MSGGQKQRIGIARALYLEPILLVLDEATSSLDAESEYQVSSLIQSLSKKTTTVIIAHRLSTVKNCKTILYMENGEIVGRGDFDSLRIRVPNFDRQANLMVITR